MRKSRKLAIGGVIGIAGGLLMIPIVLWLVFLGFIYLVGDSLLDPPPKPLVAVAGKKMNSDTQSCYDFVCNATGLEFPDGTQIDAYDDGWGHIISCFTLPDTEVDDFLSNLKLVDSRQILNLEGLENLTVPNRLLPSGVVKAIVKNAKNWAYGLTLCYDPSSKRLWVECGYRPPYD